MILADVIPGSLVVIDEAGFDVMVELGNLLGGLRKGKGEGWKRLPWGALVRTIDDQILEPIWPTLRIIDVSTPVVDVIITAMRRRELRSMNSRAFDIRDADRELDPMVRGRQKAEAF